MYKLAVFAMEAVTITDEISTQAILFGYIRSHVCG